MKLFTDSKKRYLINKVLRFLFDYSATFIGPKLVTPYKIQNYIVDNIKLRVYFPSTYMNNKTPVLIYYHGGGWVLGSIRAYDRIFRYLCYYGKSIVVGVEYRKAPEYKFPIAVEDALLAYQWVVDNLSIFFQSQKIILAGDSAGANLSTVVLSKVLETQLMKPVAQLLIYPAVNINKNTLYKIKKHKNWLVKYLGYRGLWYFLAQYFKNLEDIKSPLFNPNINPSKLTPMKTLIITCGIELLNDSIQEYLRNLKQNKCYLKHLHYPSCIHGFLQFAGVNKQAKNAITEIVKFLNSIN
jgi:acetyl esterase